MSKDKRKLTSILLIMLVLNLIYFILAYTIGKEIVIKSSWNLLHYSNNVAPLLALESAILLGLTLYLLKHDLDVQMIRMVWIFMIVIIITILGVQTSNLVAFKKAYQFMIQTSLNPAETNSVLLGEAKTHFYLPQCYLLIVEVFQCVCAIIMLSLTFISEEQRKKRQDKRNIKRKAKLQEKLDKLD